MGFDVEFDFAGRDGLYGNDLALCGKLEELGYNCILDIQKDQPVFIEKPNLIIPEKKGNRDKKRLN